jgi:HSP20 family molecular chaperone IbpA
MKHVLLFAGLFVTLAVHAQKSSLTEYPGTYKLGTGDAAEDIKVELREDKLTITGRRGSANLSLQKPDTFAVDEYGGEVIFLRNPAKQISGIKVNIPAASIDVEGTRVEDLTEYVGTYKMGSGDDVDEVKVTSKDGVLTVSGSKGSADLSRQKPDTFNVEQYGGQVIFKRTANKVSGIKIDIPAGNINAEGEKVESNSAPAAYVQPAVYNKVTVAG